MGALGALIGFALGAWAMGSSRATAFVAALQGPTVVSPSIPLALGLPTGIVIAMASGAIIAVLLALQRGEPADRQWPTFGIVLGALGIAAWLAGKGADRHWGLSVTGPTRSLVAATVALQPDALDSGALMVVGIPAGAWIAARRQGSVTWRTVTLPTFSRRTLGGLLMGIGGTLAAGCNIGNALTGLSVLAVNSAIATASMVVGVAAAILVGGIGAAISKTPLMEELR